MIGMKNKRIQILTINVYRSMSTNIKFEPTDIDAYGIPSEKIRKNTLFTTYLSFLMKNLKKQKKKCSVYS